MNRSILVLASTGMVGRRLAPLLRARDLDVRAASRTPTRDQILFDWRLPHTHDAALDGADAIFLTPPAMEATAAPMVGALLAAAQRAGLRHIVLVSSIAVGFSDEPEDSDRRRIETLVRGSGMGWTIIRPTGFMQNFSEGFLLPGILHAGAVFSATGDGVAPFIDASDIARVAEASLVEPQHSGAVYDVTGPEALSLADMTSIIAEAAQRTIAYHPVSAEALAGSLKEARVPEAYAAMLLRDQLAIGRGEASAITDTVEKVTGGPPNSFRNFAAAAASIWSPR
ncbi:NAD(P)H-binding protein [Chelatococcus asaccharovorans]|uniref:NAD(P)H-binding protein n=1 Tax=Chelatococcus asaccharovorans TaxID=28210 RepID=UPI00224C65F0|nr:NAD(P)H-binding protein [Chelatococcus asaccharovorans]CAH1664751.1 putative Uncharacterized oxidoreductase YesF [Chelatococcus asaccharovorans]CAH1682254.1 putative Uncharacterized oxidoreductase YesF [Chelatococcus asaccharovorans]